MTFEGNKKQARVPLTPEQIKDIIIYKRNKQTKQIEKLKKTTHYKILNIFNIISVIVYCEMVFCMYGPAIYTKEVCKKATIDQYERDAGPERVIQFMSVWNQDNEQYQLYIGENIQLPKPNSDFYIGRDFILQKEIKAMVSTSEAEYRLWRVIPLVFLGIAVSLITFLVFAHNMNLVNYSLIAVSLMNAINLLYFIVV